MNDTRMGPMTLRTELEHWPRVSPVRITGYTFDVVDVVVATVECNGHVGRGEAAGVYYRKDDCAAILNRIETVRPVIEAGITRGALQKLLPPGGARNAIDCALWDLQSKLEGRPAWQIAELPPPHRLLTTFTCHAESPETVAARALGFKGARAIKLKLTGEPLDIERVRAVRDVLPNIWLGVDANQGFTRGFLEHLMPQFVDLRVALIEQPFQIGHEHLLDGFQSPIPIAADESVQALSDLPSLVERFSVVNIKLDKCGGLTEGLAMARRAKALGLDLMVGNMCGTSLAMAPAYLVGQLCTVVDLDGPILLKSDRPNGVSYSDGCVSCPDAFWGC